MDDILSTCMQSSDEEYGSHIVATYENPKTGSPSSPLPVKDSAKSQPSAPRLSVEIESPTTIDRDAIFEVTVKVLYASGDPKDQEETMRPIIFHTWDLRNPDNFELQRFEDGSWKSFSNGDDICGFRIVDEPDVSVHVSHDENFRSLRPGESWSENMRLQGDAWTCLPYDAHIGDRFRYFFPGITVDWWDWGSKEEHEETVVTLPCWIVGPVQDPPNNGGRPKLVVPASEVAEFSFTAKSEETWLQMFEKRVAKARSVAQLG